MTELLLFCARNSKMRDLQKRLKVGAEKGGGGTKKVDFAKAAVAVAAAAAAAVVTSF